MKKTIAQRDWQLRLNTSDKQKRKEMCDQVLRGEIVIIDGAGQPIDLSSPPSRVDVAPLPPFAVRDRYGHVIQEAAPVEPEAAPITKSFGLGDRAAFEDCISDQSEVKKAELRAWFDQERKKHGID